MYPFLLKPVGKDYLWGGSRLNDDFGKSINLSPLAETWECSTHPDGISLVASGKFSGKNLKEVLAAHPEYLGTHPKTKGELPILIKIIDAKKDLSVQVHPSDDYAKHREGGQSGKTEMWYVLDSVKDAKLIYGLYHDVQRNVLEASIHDGTVEKYLQKVPVKKDDLFYIESGTIHAIGAGILLVEIQQNSNLTYRLYDYDREDKNGKKRPLQITKALDVAILNASTKPRQPMRVLQYRPGSASELLCRCKYFEVNRLFINTERRTLVSYQTDSSSFHVLLCITGCGTISYTGKTLNFYRGDCIFVPANSINMLLHGKAVFLDVAC